MTENTSGQLEALMPRSALIYGRTRGKPSSIARLWAMGSLPSSWKNTSTTLKDTPQLQYAKRPVSRKPESHRPRMMARWPFCSRYFQCLSASSGEPDDPLYKGPGLGLLCCNDFSCMVANFFGDRWTYLEITGLLWVLVAAAVRATDLPDSDSTSALTAVTPEVALHPLLRNTKRSVTRPTLEICFSILVHHNKLNI